MSNNTTIEVPYTYEFVLDPCGNEHELTVIVDVLVGDIWKWKEAYDESKKKKKLRHKPKVHRPKVMEEKEEEEEEDLNNEEDVVIDFTESSKASETKFRFIRSRVSHRLTAIDKGDSKGNKGRNKDKISALVDYLKTLDHATIADLIIYNRDRFQSIVKMSDADAADKYYLKEILKGKEEEEEEEEEEEKE